MNFVIRFTTLLALLALGACGGGSNDSPPPDDGGSNPPPAPVVTAPAITSQPVDASANEGDTVTFTVVASGTGLSYQWKKNGDAIAGATSASYTTPALAMSDDQATFTVTVSNAGGSVTSGNARVTVTATPPPSGGGGDEGGDDEGGDDEGPLQPLTGPADPFPRMPAPMAATPTISGILNDNRHLLSWNPTANGIYTFSLLHNSGAESRLYLPTGSFLDETWVTLADVRDIGVAVTSVVAALDIEPGDLVTEKTATVNFMIPDSMMATLDPTQLIGFAADSDGSNLHLVPIVVGNLGASITRPSIKINHLGIVGIAVATSPQQAALAAAWPTDPGDQLEAALAPGMTAQWRAVVTGGVASSKLARAGRTTINAATDDNPATSVLRGYYNDVVVPAFAAADADPSTSLAAISAAYSFLRMAELTGQSAADGEFHVVAQQVSSRINALYERYADYVAEQCRNPGGPLQLQQMLSVIRMLQLNGAEEKSNELEEILPQCSSFKLKFRADYTRSAHWFQQSQAGDQVGQEDYQADLHAVVEGEQIFSPFAPPADATLALTTLTGTQTRNRVNGTVVRDTWVKEDGTSPWRVAQLSTPIVRTRGGTAPTGLKLYLSAFLDIGSNNIEAVAFHPFTATVTSVSTSADGQHVGTIVSPQTQVNLPMLVPALPGDGTYVFGPMLIPGSGSATSQATKTTSPYLGGEMVETENVTVTLSRPE